MNDVFIIMAEEFAEDVIDSCPNPGGYSGEDKKSPERNFKDSSGD